MRLLPCLAVCAVLVLTVSCAATKPAGGGAKPATIVTADPALMGKVVAFNATGRFVILNFPVGRMAGIGQILTVSRDGLKVGEVKVSGPQRDDNIVADITAGEARVGDEVRDR